MKAQREKKKGRPEKRTTEIFSAEGKSGGDGGRAWQLFLSPLQDITGSFKV
jgi:hypothetical protein